MTKVFYQGKICENSEMAIPSTNRAFKYADGFFEAIKLYQGTPVFWKYHYSRLRDALALFQIEFIYSERELLEIIQDVIDANTDAKQATMRVMVYRAGGGKYFPESNKAELFIEVIPNKLELYTIPVLQKSAIVYDAHPLPLSTLGNHKTLNKTLHVLAAVEAKQNNCNEAILINDHGDISEAVSSNVYCLIENEIHTPPLTDGGLNGTIRKVLLAHQNELRFPIIERTIAREDLKKATEIWTSNAGSGLSAITMVGNKAYIDEVVNEVQQSLCRWAISSCSDFQENLP